MKKIMLLLMVMLMSVMTSASAATKGGKSDVTSVVPTNIIVKQTTTLDDGRVLVLYYKKEGTQCELYSTSDIKSYNERDLKHVKSTTVEVVDHTEGHLIRRATLSEVTRLVKQLLSQFL